MMYVGAAALMRPVIQRAQQEQNGIMGLCATCAGAVITIGIGNAASKILEKTIDKCVDFWDDVKPSGPAKKSKETPSEEEKNDG